MRMRPATSRNRRGVTLVELLVVIAIMVALMTLAAAVGPRFAERQRVGNGASMLQSWLRLAKSRALRDQRPVGIRLPPVANAPGAPGAAYITEVQFIEVPDENVGGTIVVQNPSLNTVQFVTQVSFNPTTDPNAMIQAGDILVIPGSYDPRRIVSVAGPTPSGAQFSYTITLDRPLSSSAGQPFTTLGHRFFRKARPIMGEQPLQLPVGIGIDISRDVTATNPSWYRFFPPLGNTGGSNPFDILFAPNGQVIGYEGLLGSRICLWVRDVTDNDPLPTFAAGTQATDPTKLPPGDNALVTVYTRTGQVSWHPVDPSGLTPGSNWNPFRFTQDGISSGQ